MASESSNAELNGQTRLKLGSALPSGTVTFLLTDVEGSTSAWLRDPEAMSVALARHDALIERLVADYGGQLVRPRGEGDSRFAVFVRPSDAVAAAGAVQLAFADERWPLAEPLRVRMAIHTGETDLRLGDYYGPAINHCGRLRGVAYGRQVLVSAVTADLVREALSPGLGLRDLGLHQLKDIDRAERVWQLVHARLPSDFPPLGSVPTTLHNLPHQLSSFVGRDQAVAELDGLLTTTRLLTLTGPGGIGKTRLALRVALDALADYPDGVWLVRLDALADPELVTGAVASVLRVREQPGRGLTEALADALSARHLLLVLDNCEHLLYACAELADTLLQASPRLRLLATSRERLGVPGEVVWQVPPLSLPTTEPATATEQLSRGDAVRLFADRAGAARPGFAVTDQNAERVVQVCRRLDGLPLAVELAAARMNALSVEQLAQRLDDRLRLLTGGSRTAVPRQQTLRAAIDWSHDLLSEPERVLLRRLAVFAGEWTLEAAEAVCASPGQAPDKPAAVAAETVLDRLCSLVDKSLVSAEAIGTDRYQLLETIRQYAVERLEVSGEAETLRRQHAEYFLALAEAAEPELRGAGQLVWFKRLEAEHDNLRAALAWTLERGHAELALRLGWALWYFWWVRGYASEGRRLLERVLAINARRTVARAAVLNATGYLASALDEPDQAIALHEQALAVQRELGDRPGIAMSLRCLGRVALLQGEYARARELLHEALAPLRELGDGWGVGMALNNLANLALRQGDSESAAELYHQSLAVRKEIGDMVGIAVCLSSLASVAQRRGEMDQAEVLAEQALTLQRELGSTAEIADSLCVLGYVARARSDYQRAAALFEEALLLERQAGNRRGISGVLRNLGSVAARQGDYGRAAAMIKEALVLQRTVADRTAIAATFEALAYVAAAKALPAQVVRLLGAADALRDAIGGRRTLVARAEYEQHLGTARALLGEAAFALEWAAGHALPLEQAIAEALDRS